ncbi:MAG: hypothetical protein ABI132_10850 [Rhodanobacteraceae bacterium]
MKREVWQAAKTPALILLGLLALVALNVLFAWLPLGIARPFVNVAVCAVMVLILMTLYMGLLRARAVAHGRGGRVPLDGHHDRDFADRFPGARLRAAALVGRVLPHGAGPLYFRVF